MELRELVGLHQLSGVDMHVEAIERYGRDFENCQVINFVLDGITYTAIEDPKDGYRSSLAALFVTDYIISNSFAPCAVIGRLRDRDTGEACEILELVDARTGESVMQVGTEYTDNYYPMWVANFAPESMVINRPEFWSEQERLALYISQLRRHKSVLCHDDLVVNIPKRRASHRYSDLV
jgi:hypothetical protein